MNYFIELAPHEALIYIMLCFCVSAALSILSIAIYSLFCESVPRADPPPIKDYTA